MLSMLFENLTYKLFTKKFFMCSSFSIPWWNVSPLKQEKSPVCLLNCKHRDFQLEVDIKDLLLLKNQKHPSFLPRSYQHSRRYLETQAYAKENENLFCPS